MVLQVGLQPVLGDFGCALGGQATKSTVLVRPKDLFMLILSWKANFLGPVVLQVGRQPPWVILAVFWAARPQNPLSV